VTTLSPRRGTSQSSLLASGLSLAGAVTTMFVTFGIARLVSQNGLEAAGVFFLPTALISIVGTTAALGTQTGLVYFMPRVMTDGGSPRKLVWLAVRPVLLVSGTAAVAVFVVAGPLAELIADERADDIATVLRILAPTIPAWSLTNALLGATRGLGTINPTVAIQQVARPLTQMIGLVALAVADRLEPIAISVAWGAPVVLAAGATVVATARLGGLSDLGHSAVAEGEFWAYARPRAVSTGLQIAHERVDILIVGAVLGTGLAGVYGGLSRFATAGNFIAFALTQAVSPNLRKAITSGDHIAARQLFHWASGWMVLTSWPYLLIVATKFVPLALLLDESYRADAGLLSILVLGMIVSAVCGPVEIHLLMRGRSTATLTTTAVALVVDVVLVVALAGWLGITGAGIAWALSLSFKNLLNTYLSQRWYGITSASRATLIAAIGSMGAILPIAFLTPNNYRGLFVTLVVGGGLWLGWVWINRAVLGFTTPAATVSPSPQRPPSRTTDSASSDRRTSAPLR
jgi:O-antigen/teichoic acid export membrane protein